MSPDDVELVERSWAELRLHRDALVDRVTTSLAAGGAPDAASTRARWLVAAVDELVGLLIAPSQLGRRARQLAATWPCPGSTPSFRIDGQAWMGAARVAGAPWTAEIERAWRHGWLLLSDVLAEESLSPFAGPVGAYVGPGPEDT